MVYLELLVHVLFTLCLGYYFISAMQWYSYKLERVVLHFNRYDWHFYFFMIPIFIYYISGVYFLLYFFIIYIPTLFLWYRAIDKKLIFTPRIKRFFGFLALAIVFQDLLCFLNPNCLIYGVIFPLFFSYLASYLYEKILFYDFKKRASKKLLANPNLKVIAITASYGKTSIKNFLYEVLSQHYNVYKTPRSVNTLGGIIKDINENLDDDIVFYIVEAGARAKGDILEIAQFVQPHIAIVGQIGEQHIEYFKTLQNIRDTKMELLQSARLEHAFVHTSAHVKPEKHITFFGDHIEGIIPTLEGIDFDLIFDAKQYHFHANLLGAFNAQNLDVVIRTARYLGLDMETIQERIAHLSQVEHRLQKIEANGKIIIDDSYNGNLEGMVGSYELVSQYSGRKVIITPGIVESDEASNIKLANKIDAIFDLVIITSKINAKILAQHIQHTEKIILKDKGKIEKVLAENTQMGDLILFSNDAPTFM
ncbi:UDP-N-acetylmuramoyl-tripeptide--D-alanyl-D-alanine ligase [Sulfurospirillum sp. 1612]|uniref:UDP-N-acetylmuramoyl-tripeptide--D-alanyl-D- alanine ligase n=1 Tax=Sulfurospirillum sp. 1612 TaxID=3094835 RepID=UPI002F91F36B